MKAQGILQYSPKYFFTCALNSTLSLCLGAACLPLDEAQVFEVLIRGVRAIFAAVIPAAAVASMTGPWDAIAAVQHTGHCIQDLTFFNGRVHKQDDIYACQEDCL